MVSSRSEPLIVALEVAVLDELRHGEPKVSLGSKAGGPEKYTGRDMVKAHEHLKMTDVHFMAAGDQITRVLAKYKVPAPETQEVMCLIVSFHDEAIC